MSAHGWTTKHKAEYHFLFVVAPIQSLFKEKGPDAGRFHAVVARTRLTYSAGVKGGCNCSLEQQKRPGI